MHPLLPLGVGVVGLALIVVSIVMYYVRTRDEQLFQRFWLGKDLLSDLEYWMNRIGFGLSIAAIIWLLLLRLVLRTY